MKLKSNHKNISFEDKNKKCKGKKKMKHNKKIKKNIWFYIKVKKIYLNKKDILFKKHHQNIYFDICMCLFFMDFK